MNTSDILTGKNTTGRQFASYDMVVTNPDRVSTPRRDGLLSVSHDTAAQRKDAINRISASRPLKTMETNYLSPLAKTVETDNNPSLHLTPTKAAPSPNNEPTNPNRVQNSVRVQMPDRPLRHPDRTACHPERSLCHPERSRRISSLLACAIVMALCLFASITAKAQGITQHPANQTITAGGNASFSVTATAPNPPLIQYQWYVTTSGGSSSPVSNGGVYSGAGTATLTLTNVPQSYNGNKYACVVIYQSLGYTSNVATLTVNPAYSLSLSPTSLEFPAEGGTKSFTITSNVSWVIDEFTATWISRSPASGNNNGTITVTVSPNTTAYQRGYTINVIPTSGGLSHQSVSVTQAAAPGAPPVITTTPGALPDGNSWSTIQCNADCYQFAENVVNCRLRCYRTLT